jgi:hypothetical protein
MAKVLRWHGITDFAPDELARESAGVPPLGMFDNVVPTLVRLQRFRTYVGKPILVCTDAHQRRGFRSLRTQLDLRQELEGLGIQPAATGMHPEFNALDFEVEGMTPSEVHAALRKLFPESDRKLWGLGESYGTFTHWDTRGLLGRPAPARW